MFKSSLIHFLAWVSKDVSWRRSYSSICITISFWIQGWLFIFNILIRCGASIIVNFLQNFCACTGEKAGLILLFLSMLFFLLYYSSVRLYEFIFDVWGCQWIQRSEKMFITLAWFRRRCIEISEHCYRLLSGRISWVYLTYLLRNFFR